MFFLVHFPDKERFGLRNKTLSFTFGTWRRFFPRTIREPAAISAAFRRPAFLFLFFCRRGNGFPAGAVALTPIPVVSP